MLRRISKVWASASGSTERAAAASEQLDALTFELSVLLSDDERVRALNRDFRGKDKTTDVLSFEAGGAPGQDGLLGDVVISVEQAARQAPGTLDDELVRLLAHGLCHLAGHDHQRTAEARRMRAAELVLLEGTGVDAMV